MQDTVNDASMTDPELQPEQWTGGVNVEGGGENGNDAISPNGNNSTNKSALQDNIDRKGKNAYYFAHSHKATGPAWDGKPEPKLLARTESTVGHLVSSKQSFDYSKSNITTYAFLDDGMKVKLYIELEGVGEKCLEEDIALDYSESSFCIVINNYKPEPQCLSFGKLTAEITKATFRVKQDRVIITLTKAKEGPWHTINDKGNPDHEMV